VVDNADVMELMAPWCMEMIVQCDENVLWDKDIDYIDEEEFLSSSDKRIA
jgi:hypothetical protein